MCAAGRSSSPSTAVPCLRASARSGSPGRCTRRLRRARPAAPTPEAPKVRLEPRRPPDPGAAAAVAGPDPAAGAPAAIDVERSAVRSTTLLVARTVVLQLFTAGATIALARLLVPSDFGAFAVAQSAQSLGRTLVELGLPAALVRRDAPPSLAEQRSMTGLMTAGAWVVAALALALAFVVLPAAGADSRIAPLTAVAPLSPPFYAVPAVPAPPPARPPARRPPLPRRGP